MGAGGFSGILGQERAKTFLRGVLDRDKIPHAYLFTGIPGVGKTLTATALAMVLNCRAPIEGDSCGRCPSCRQVIGGNAPDFVTVEPDGRHIKIEQIRELNRSLGFAPVSGRYRVCVIRQAEVMTEEAANSFLKTLEEPPPGNLFILNAVEPLDLLPTIVSRCQRVAFQPLPVEAVTAELVRAVGISEEKAAVAAQVSEGSLGKALRLCEGDFIDRRSKWLTLVSDIPSFSTITALETVAEWVGREKKAAPERTGESGEMEMLGVWTSWYRDLLVMKVEGDPKLIINTDFSGKLQKLSRRFTLGQLLESIALIEEAKRDFRRSRNSVLAAGRMALGLRRLSEPDPQRASRE